VEDVEGTQGIQKVEAEGTDNQKLSLGKTGGRVLTLWREVVGDDAQGGYA